MITRPSSYTRKIQQALSCPPICLLTSSTIMCLGYIAPLLLTHLGTLKNKCNNNLMYVNMERERERSIQNLLDTSIGDKMSLGFEPMRGLFDFDGILIECTLTTKKRERERWDHALILSHTTTK